MHSLPFIEIKVLKPLKGWCLVPRINGDGKRLDPFRLLHSSARSDRASDICGIAKMPPLSDLDHYKIETEILGDGKEVVSYEYRNDVGLGLRNAKYEYRWSRQANLGRGSSSDVWLEIQKGNPDNKRAVKAISKRRLLETKVDYRSELKALTEFSKPKYRQKGIFVDFFGWWDNHDSVFLAMEFFPWGNLEDNILPRLPGVPDPIDIMYQLLEGLEIMHTEGFAHRDLKPANIFVVQTGPMWWVKIGDFGITKRIQNQDTSLRTFTGTHDYMAPEFFGYGDDVDEERSDYTHAVDLWALGCVAYRFYTGKVPFPSYPNLRPLQRYCSGQTVFPAKDLGSTGCPEVVVNLIMDLLRPVPSQRPSAHTALAVLGPMNPPSKSGTLFGVRLQTLQRTTQAQKYSIPPRKAIDVIYTKPPTSIQNTLPRLPPSSNGRVTPYSNPHHPSTLHGLPFLAWIFLTSLLHALLYVRPTKACGELAL